MHNIIYYTCIIYVVYIICIYEFCIYVYKIYLTSISISICYAQQCIQQKRSFAVGCKSKESRRGEGNDALIDKDALLVTTGSGSWRLWFGLMWQQPSNHTEKLQLDTSPGKHHQNQIWCIVWPITLLREEIKHASIFLPIVFSITQFSGKVFKNSFQRPRRWSYRWERQPAAWSQVGGTSVRAQCQRKPLLSPGICSWETGTQVIQGSKGGRGAQTQPCGQVEVLDWS